MEVAAVCALVVEAARGHAVASVKDVVVVRGHAVASVKDVAVALALAVEEAINPVTMTMAKKIAIVI